MFSERKQSLSKVRNSYPASVSRQVPPSSPARLSSLSSSSHHRISLEPKLEIIHQSSSHALERSQSTISSNRFSGYQEPDSPATCLALKIMRSRLRYKYDDLNTNPGVVYAQKSSRISHCADVKVGIFKLPPYASLSRLLGVLLKESNPPQQPP